MSDIVKTVEQAAGKVATTAKTAWSVVLEFFIDANGKFSHKRLIAVACTVVSIRQFMIGDWAAGAALLLAAVVLGVVSAVTKT